MRMSNHSSTRSSRSAESDITGPAGYRAEEAAADYAGTDRLQPEASATGFTADSDAGLAVTGTAEQATRPTADPARSVTGLRAWPTPASSLATALIAIGGLWVAISPWFLTLQRPGFSQAAVSDLIIGLAVAVIGLLAGLDRRALTWHTTAVLAGIWLIIAPFILTAKYSITASMYWSNICAGAIITALGLGLLTAGRLRSKR
jgi:hypothetical protein